MQIIELDFPSGRVIREHALAPQEFGEGIAIVGDRIVVLLYQRNFALEYDWNDLTADPRAVPHPMKDGWGLAYNKEQNELVGTDGSRYTDAS